MTNRTGTGGRRPSANERLKARWPLAFWTSILAAMLVHTVAFAFWPSFEVMQLEHGALMQTALMPPMFVPEIVAPRVELPRRPQRLAIVPLPVDAEAVDFATPALAFASMYVDAFDAPDLPQPSAGGAAEDVQRFGAVVPITVLPELLNRRQLMWRLRADYERILSWIQVTGQTVVRLWLDDAGEVAKYEILQSSGDAGLDRVAEKAVVLMRFSPALKFGRPSATVVTLPVRFHDGSN